MFDVTVSVCFGVCVGWRDVFVGVGMNVLINGAAVGEEWVCVCACVCVFRVCVCVSMC